MQDVQALARSVLAASVIRIRALLRSYIPREPMDHDVKHVSIGLSCAVRMDLREGKTIERYGMSIYGVSTQDSPQKELESLSTSSHLPH